MDKYCRITIPPREPNKNINSHNQEPRRIWIRKHDQFNTKECNLDLQSQHKKRGWYVDSGYSKHIIGDKDRFMTLNKERDGLV